MAEYITKEQAKSAIKKRLGTMDLFESRFNEDIDAISTADVVEVVHGRWTEAEDGDGAVCSVCGEDFCTIIHETNRFKHCPNCGAKMDKEEPNGTD